MLDRLCRCPCAQLCATWRTELACWHRCTDPQAALHYVSVSQVYAPFSFISAHVAHHTNLATESDIRWQLSHIFVAYRSSTLHVDALAGCDVTQQMLRGAHAPCHASAG